MRADAGEHRHAALPRAASSSSAASTRVDRARPAPSARRRGAARPSTMPPSSAREADRVDARARAARRPGACSRAPRAPRSRPRASPASVTRSPSSKRGASPSRSHHAADLGAAAVDEHDAAAEARASSRRELARARRSASSARPPSLTTTGAGGVRRCHHGLPCARQRPVVSGQPSMRFRFCSACAGRALHQVVDRRGRRAACVPPCSVVTATSQRFERAHRARLGPRAGREHAHERLVARSARRRARAPSSGVDRLRERRVRGEQDAARHRHELRREADRDASPSGARERALHLGDVRVLGADLVERGAAVELDERRAQRRRAPGAAHARERADHDRPVEPAGLGGRQQRERGRGRVAAGVRDRASRAAIASRNASGRP